MALDRTWYNTLVDDDGSNTVGSVWDKADVDSLMDAIDAEIARLESAWLWHAAILTAGTGTWTGGSVNVTYRTGPDKTVEIAWAIESTTISGGPSPHLAFTLPFTSQSLGTGPWVILGDLYVNATHEAAFVQISPNSPHCEIYRLGGQNFPASQTPVYCRGQMVYRRA